MKRIGLFLCVLLTAMGLKAQTVTPAPILSGQQIQLPLSNPPVPPASVSAHVVGNAGTATYYYWVVANDPIGNSAPSMAAVATGVPNVLDASHYVTVSWTAAPGAMSYDVLRTGTPQPPAGSCDCAVATGVTGTSVEDSGAALQSYLTETFDPSSIGPIVLRDVASGTGLTKLSAQVNGKEVWSIDSHGSMAPSILTPTVLLSERNATSFPGSDLGAQINAAISDLGSAGGRIIVPRGSYTMSTAVTITQPNIIIVGQGAQATEITCTVSTVPCITIDVGGVDTTTPLENGVLEGFSLFGNSNVGAVGIEISDSTGVALRDLSVMNFTGSNAKGVYFRNGSAWTERWLLDHVSIQNDTYGTYFDKGSSTSGSFGYGHVVASHFQVGNYQTGVYVANGADLYHSTFDFSVNAAPHALVGGINENGGVVVEVAGAASQNVCSVTGEYTGSGTGSGVDHPIVADSGSQFSCSGYFDVSNGMGNSGMVFVGSTDEDGGHSTLWGTLPDGSTAAWPTLVDRADTSLGSTHPLFGLFENNGLSKAGFIFNFHNTINDGRAGIQLYTSSGFTPGWLAGAKLVGTWGSDGSLRTAGPVQVDSSSATPTGGSLFDWNETGGQGETNFVDLYEAVQNGSPAFQFIVRDTGGTKHTIAAFDRQGDLSAGGGSFSGAVNANVLEQNGVPVAYIAQTFSNGNAQSAFPSGVTANQLSLYALEIPTSLQASKISYWVDAGDATTTDAYSLGVYNSSGTLVAHVAPVDWQYSGTARTDSLVEGTVTLPAGMYFVGLTGDAATATLYSVCGAQKSFVDFASSSYAATTSGALPATITAPTLAPAQGCAPYIFLSK